MGMKFTPRLTAPSTTDKHWISTSKGGLSICLVINNSGSVLPNCVGYAWGRFYEIIGEKPKLANLNAEDWYVNTVDGYKRSATPKLGAIACWRKGQVHNPNDGYGHVAVVEKIEANGDILVSNSDYGGSRFYTITYKKANGYNSGSLTFQGFILPPVDFENDNSTSSTNSTNTISNGEIKVGDIVEFTGNTHYASSTAVSGVKCTPGEAKVTLIAKGTAHPYHLVSCGKGSSVYGWVNAADIKSGISVGDSVKIKAGAKTYDGGSLASFVYDNVYTVMEIKGDRVVFGINGAVTAAIKAEDLIKQ